MHLCVCAYKLGWAWNITNMWMNLGLSTGGYKTTSQQTVIQPADNLPVTSQPSTQSQKHACARAKISYLSLTQIWRSTLLKTAQILGLHIFKLNKWLLLGGKYKAKQKSLKMFACRGSQFVNSYKLCVCVYVHNSILSWLCTFIPLIPMPCCGAFSLFLVLWY